MYAVAAASPLLFRKPNTDKKITFFVAVGSLFFLSAPLTWMKYLVLMLPEWSRWGKGLCEMSHSLKSIPTHQIGTVIFLLLILTWLYAAYRASYKHIDLVFAGALAITTFDNGISYDYNLITIFPLLIVMFTKLHKNPTTFASICFFSLLFFSSAGRYFLHDHQWFINYRIYGLTIPLILIPFVYLGSWQDLIRLKNYFKILKNQFLA